MTDQIITDAQVREAIERRMRAHNEDVEARRDVATLLRKAKDQGLSVTDGACKCASGCECECPTIHAGGIEQGVTE